MKIRTETKFIFLLVISTLCSSFALAQVLTGGGADPGGGPKRVYDIIPISSQITDQIKGVIKLQHKVDVFIGRLNKKRESLRPKSKKIVNLIDAYQFLSIELLSDPQQIIINMAEKACSSASVQNKNTPMINHEVKESMTELFNDKYLYYYVKEIHSLSSNEAIGLINNLNHLIQSMDESK